jgi:hypothetical protein
VDGTVTVIVAKLVWTLVVLVVMSGVDVATNVVVTIGVV